MESMTIQSRLNLFNEPISKEPRFLIQSFCDGKLGLYTTCPHDKKEAEKIINQMVEEIECAQRELGRVIAHKFTYGWFDKMPEDRRKLHPRSLYTKFLQTQKITKKRVVNNMFSFEIVSV